MEHILGFIGLALIRQRYLILNFHQLPKTKPFSTKQPDPRASQNCCADFYPIDLQIKVCGAPGVLRRV